MSNLPQDDRETRKVVDDFTRMLRQKSKEEREALLIQARDEALEEELAEAREQSEQEAAVLREKLAYDPIKESERARKERDRARETAKSAALLLIMLLLILLLIAAATGRTDILPIAGGSATQTLGPYLRTTTGPIRTRVFVPTVLPGTTPEVDPVFVQTVADLSLRDPECNIGNPITPGYTDDQGLRYQWFQRVLLHEMPAYIDNPRWHIQGYLLGREVTTAIPLPTSAPFLSQPDAYLFRETGYRVSDPFLSFWTKCDGEWLLGYPVSDLVYEVLTPKAPLSPVQYFERGRLEYHQDDPSRPVQFGLLGLIKSMDENFTPVIVLASQLGTPVAPPPAATALPAATAVPPPAATALPAATAVPPAATATALPAATAVPPPAATTLPAATAYPGP
jgi:hypothetical protein